MESLSSKTCTKCNEIKPLTEFYKRKSVPSGRMSACIPCERSRGKDHYEKNKDALTEKHIAYYQSNREKMAIKQKQYRETNKETISEYQKSFYQKNKEKVLERSRRRYTTKKEEVLKNQKNYRKDNPEKLRSHSRRYRAAILNNGVQKYTEQEVLSTYGTACSVCTTEIDMTAPRRTGRPGWENGLHIDHLIPISKGGPDTLENVRPTHAKCNLEKSAKLLTDGPGEVSDECQRFHKDY